MTGDLSPADVVVVGGGPVGMSAALCLARLGVASTVVERRTTPSRHPKARGVRLRTMELFRQWGLEPALRSGALPAEARRFIYCDSLAGAELARSPSIGVAEAPFSPTTSVRVAQDGVEAALRASIANEPLISLRTGTEVIDLDQDDEGVTLTAEPADTTRAGQDRARLTLRARYVIAADGVGSTLRRLLGVAMSGQPVLAYWQSIYWHGDIDRWAGERPCIQFFTGARTGHPASVASVDGRRRWVTMVTLPPGQKGPEPLSGPAAIDVVRRAVGEPHLAVEVLDVATWRLSATVADTWTVGRVFLAGDAAHSFPPTGGFGMNTGVQDVHNLAWKLALVLTGRAGRGLLTTYQDERQPIAKTNADWSVANGSRVREINQALAEGDSRRVTELLADQREHVLALEQDLGFTYRSTAVPGRSGEPPPTSPGDFTPAVIAGRRAPHAWLIAPGGRRTSTIDLFQRSFVLLTGSNSSAWRAAAWAATGPALPEVEVVSVGEDLQPDAAFEALYRLPEQGPVLVRPDGFVAARLPKAPTDEVAALTSVLAQATR